MDTKIGIVTEQEQKGVYITQFKIYDLAIFTYYIQSNKQCYIIDPTFDTKILKDFIAKRNSQLKYIVLTHYHADFLSAHGEFGVPVIMGERAKRDVNNFQLKEMKNNEKFRIGNVGTRVLATPGHTTQSSCYILANQDEKQFCIFTGDTVFLRQVGRPDLAVASNISSKDLAGMLFDSIQKIKSLDKQLRLYPGHGSGSACGKSIGSGNFCTLKAQHEFNYGFVINDRHQFIEKLTQGLQAPPQYFFHDAKINQQGASQKYEQILKRCKKPLQMKEIKDLNEKKVVIVDTRPEIKNGLIEGSYWLSKKGDLSGWISMILKPQEQFIILVQLGKQQEVIERFLRIGYFNILGFNSFDMESWNLSPLHKIQLKAYDQLDKNTKYVHIDVRNTKELQDQGIFEDSLLISLPNLKSRIDEVKDFVQMNKDSKLLVNCKTGLRARFAGSILLKNGIQVVILNQSIDNLKQKGYKMIQYKGQDVHNSQCCQIF